MDSRHKYTDKTKLTSQTYINTCEVSKAIAIHNFFSHHIFGGTQESISRHLIYKCWGRNKEHYSTTSIVKPAVAWHDMYVLLICPCNGYSCACVMLIHSFAIAARGERSEGKRHEIERRIWARPGANAQRSTCIRFKDGFKQKILPRGKMFMSSIENPGLKMSDQVFDMFAY